MTITNVLVNTDDIVVYGGPSAIDLQLEIGAQGARGSKIFAYAQDPRVGTLPSTIEPLYGDFYINTQAGSQYAYMYQFAAEEGTDGVWKPQLELGPTIYSVVRPVEFTDGIADLTVAKSTITAKAIQPTADQFVIKYSVENDNPVATSISSLTYNHPTLTINMKAAEYNIGTGAWAPLSGVVNVHLYISIVV
jgi:hypothetical protein